MYRALALALNAGFDGRSRMNPDEDEVRLLLERIPLHFSIKENRLEISYGEKLLSEELRSPEMSDAASRISQVHAVREFLVACQRKLAEQGASIVAEGRDTATVVFPKADLKVFLTADLKARAKRRFAEYIDKGINLSLEEMQRRIAERDEADANRDHSPMRPAQGAILLDTSHLSVKEVVDRLSEKAQSLFKLRSSTDREL
jgi:cytidylate kinase